MPRLTAPVAKIVARVERRLSHVASARFMKNFMAVIFTQFESICKDIEKKNLQMSQAAPCGRFLRRPTAGCQGAASIGFRLRVRDFFS
jgi:hypothetical protein